MALCLLVHKLGTEVASQSKLVVVFPELEGGHLLRLHLALEQLPPGLGLPQDSPLPPRVHVLQVVDFDLPSFIVGLICDRFKQTPFL